MDEQLLLSVPQMARRLSIGKTQAWAIVGRGEVPVIKIGRSTRVPKDAVDDWALSRSSVHPVGAGESIAQRRKAVLEVEARTAEEVRHAAARRSG